MTNKIEIILIDKDENSRKLIKDLLKNQQQITVTAEVDDPATGYELVKEHNPHIVILDLFVPETESLKLASRISHDFPQTTLMVTSAKTKSDVILKAMRAGAREFLSKPIKAEDLKVAVEQVVRQKYETGAGKIITLFGVKGGVGATTIATNLAVNLAGHSEKSVLLIDLNLQLGHVSVFLDAKSKYSIVDVANNFEGIDAEALKNALPQHASGVYLLSEPARLEEAESLTAVQLEQILSMLKSAFDYIIIDSSNKLDEVTLKALDESDTILVILTNDLPSIYNARRSLDIFRRMGYDEKKLLLIINRHDFIKGVDFSDLEKSVNIPVFWKIPNQNYAEILDAINQGTPISITLPKSKTSLSFKDLAARLNGGKPAANGEAKQKGGMLKEFLQKLME